MTNQSEFQKILAKPGQRALAGVGIENFEQLAKFTEAEIMELHGIGKNGMNRLQIALAEKGLSFATTK
ncbi:DNA-binding protein [Psychrobacillus sp. FSL H8-0484]|uniref:DNA-binding protein n=1 Tax=Psychrobacillus sp. FSL H8-0484 TaxID=2921390 RepID=UPI0030F8875B